MKRKHITETKKRKIEEFKRIHYIFKKEKHFYYDHELIDYINTKYHVLLFF